MSDCWENFLKLVLEEWSLWREKASEQTGAVGPVVACS